MQQGLNEQINSPETLKDLSPYFIKFANIFQMDQCDAAFFAHLKSRAIPTHPTCNKKITSIYKCLDCETNNTACICSECYENSKEKHIGHRVSFFCNRQNASCDCGDANLWNPAGFCSKHKGFLNTDDDIAQFIAASFNEEQVKALREELDALTAQIQALINLNVITQTSLSAPLDQFLTFLNALCEANQAIVHLIAESFMKSLPIFTNHICFKITPTSAEMVKDGGNLHECCCPFVKTLLEVYDKTKKHSPFLYQLLNSFKLKTVMGISFIASFHVMIVNQIDSFFDFSIQVLFPEANAVILNSADLMQFFIGKVGYLFAFAADKFHLLEELVERFQETIFSLLKFSTFSLINNHLDVFKWMIEMMGTLQYANCLTDDAKGFVKEGCNSRLLTIELNLLYLASYLFSIFDYNDSQKTHELLNHFLQNMNYAKPLEAKEHTFHIPLYRAFSMFLTAYLFNYSLSNNVDLKTALNDFFVAYDYPYEKVILQVFKVSGMVLSVKHGLWVYYGENMENYPLYYQQILPFSMSDFALLQLLCSHPKYAHLLSIDSILKATNVNGSYAQLKTLIMQSEADLDSVDVEWTKEKDNAKALLYGKDVMDLLGHLQRDNSYLLDLYFFSYSELKSKKLFVENFSIILQLEGAAISSIIKRKIAQMMMANNNYCPFPLISESKSRISNTLTKESDLTAVITEILYKNTSNIHQKVVFSLKPENYHLIDLAFCIDSTLRANTERCLMNFKKKEISLLQTPTVLALCLETSLRDDFNAALYSPGNVKWLCLFTSTLLSRSKWDTVLRHYLFSVLKHLAILLSLNCADSTLLTESFKVLKSYSQQIGILLSVPGVSLDENQLSLCSYVKDSLSKCFHAVIQLPAISKESEKEQEKKIDKAKELQSKYMKQFKEKNKQFIEAMGESSIAEHTNEPMNEEGLQCIICRAEMKQNSYYETPYGRFGLVVKDMFIHHTIKNSLLMKYKQSTELASSCSFEEFISDIYSKKSYMRLLSCNHYAHFSCFEEFTLQNEYINQCPFCKQTFNVFIPFVNLKPKSDIMQGLSLKQFFIAHQQKTDPLSEEGLELKAESFNWQPPVRNFIESVLFNKKEKKVISDLLKEEDLLNSSYQRLLDSFHSFFVFYENYTTQQISLYNTFFASIRLTIKAGYLKASFFVQKFNKVIALLLSSESMEIIKGEVGSVIEETLFLFIVLFGSDDDSEQIVLLFRMFLPFIYAEMLLVAQYGSKCLLNAQDAEKITYDNLVHFIETNEAKRLLASYLYKVDLCQQIIMLSTADSGNANVIIDKSLDYYLTQLGLSQFKDKSPLSLLSLEAPPYWPQSIAPIDLLKEFIATTALSLTQPTRISPYLFEVGLELKVRFSLLPADMLEFTLMMNNTPCMYCKRKDSSSVLCLICGAKVCGKNGCSVLTILDKIQSFWCHSLQCGMGSTVYIDLDFGEAIVIRNFQLVLPNVFIYLNAFGEPPGKHNKILKDYELSQIALDKVKNMYITYSNRKSK